MNIENLNRVRKVLKADNGSPIRRNLSIVLVNHTVGGQQVTSYSNDNGTTWFADPECTTLRQTNYGDLDPRATYRGRQQSQAELDAIDAGRVARGIEAPDTLYDLQEPDELKELEKKAKQLEAAETSPEWNTTPNIDPLTVASRQMEALETASDWKNLTVPKKDPILDAAKRMEAEATASDWDRFTVPTDNPGTVTPALTATPPSEQVINTDPRAKGAEEEKREKDEKAGADEQAEKDKVEESTEKAVDPKKSITNGVSSAISSLNAAADGNVDGAVKNVGSTLSSLGEGIGGKTGETLGKIGAGFTAVQQGAAVGGAVLKALGAPTTDGMTKTDLFMESDLMKMTGLGFINAAFGSESDKFSKDLLLMSEMGGAYSGSDSIMDEAAKKAGKKYGLFSSSARKKANEEIAEARRQTNVIQDINDEATARRVSGGDIEGYAQSYKMRMNGGYDQRYMRAAKEGGNVEIKYNLTEVDEIQHYKEGGFIYESFNFILEDPDTIKQFKEGGNIEVIEVNTLQKSVIPEGALHKNKHHLNQVGIDDSELTKKGIPVVDNKGEQQAEIELNEIIFTLEVTKELEKRYKEFYEENTSNSKKDELALEAGKLLWKEIIYNTDDRTGLIDTLKQGGVIKALEGNKIEESKDNQPVDKYKYGGVISLEDITLMVKQALINIITK